MGGAEHAGLARMVPRRVARLVAALVLLVYDNEAEARRGREHSAARPDHHARFSAVNAPPFGELF